MSKLYIVTVATKSEFYFTYLVESCKRYGTDLTILGYGEKWKGYNWKFKLMVEFLQKIDNNDIVCFVDGFDVICNRNLNELKDEFLNLKKINDNIKIIIAHDKTSNKSIDYISKINMNNFFDDFINSGTYIGFANDLLNILNESRKMDLKDNADDQYLLTQYYKKNKKIFYIDIQCDYFFTMNNSLNNIDNYFIIKDNKAYYNNKQPFFIHAPGYTVLNNLIQKLGYNLTNKEGEIILNNMKKNANKKLKYWIYHIIKKYYIYIIILFFVIYILIKKYKHKI
jgi:hypothetical protein